MKKFNTVQEIQLERANQRENKIIYILLGVLLGEIDRLPTRDEPTADQIYSVVKKMYDNAKEMAPFKMEALAEVEYLKESTQTIFLSGYFSLNSFATLTQF